MSSFIVVQYYHSLIFILSYHILLQLINIKVKNIIPSSGWPATATESWHQTLRGQKLTHPAVKPHTWHSRLYHIMAVKPQ